MVLATAAASIARDKYKTTLTARNHTGIADEPAEDNGSDLGPVPHELLLEALGACTAITLRMYADRKEWPLEAVDVELDISKDGANTTINRRINITGPMLTTEQHSRLIEVANACPIHRILTGPIKINTIE
ncbi:MAG: OsmC family protein [Sphingobacteriales bacterium JAD_PAG50586_3]|nr:MAG: OsmC family protein [Sphingobacteriales bacterium JAD_PAG50586_3]